MCARRYIDWRVSSRDTERPLGYRVELGNSRLLPSISSSRITFDSLHQFQYSPTGLEKDLVVYPRNGIDNPSSNGLVRFDLRGESPQRNLIYVNGASIRRIAVDSKEVMATNNAVLLDPQGVAIDEMRNEVWVLDSTGVVAVMDSDLNLVKTIQMDDGSVAAIPDGSRNSFWQVLSNEVRLKSMADGSTLRLFGNVFGGRIASRVIAHFLSQHTGNLYLSVQFSDSSYAFIHLGRAAGDHYETDTFVSGIAEWTSGEVLLCRSASSVLLYNGSHTSPTLMFDLSIYGIAVDRIACDVGDIYVTDRTAGRISRISTVSFSPVWIIPANGVADMLTLDVATALDAGVSDNRLITYWSADAVGTIRDYGFTAVNDGASRFPGGTAALGKLLSGFPATPIWAKISSRDDGGYDSSSSSLSTSSYGDRWTMELFYVNPTDDQPSLGIVPANPSFYAPLLTDADFWWTKPDGTPFIGKVPKSYYLSHSLPTPFDQPGWYTVRCSHWEMVRGVSMLLTDMSSTDVSEWVNHLPSLQFISVDQSNVSGDISGWVLPNNLQTISMGQTYVTGDISGWVLPSGMTYLTIGPMVTGPTTNHNSYPRPDVDSAVSGDITKWILPSGFGVLYLGNTYVSGDITKWPLPPTMTRLDLGQTDITCDMSVRFSGGPSPSSSSQGSSESSRGSTGSSESSSQGSSATSASSSRGSTASSSSRGSSVSSISSHSRSSRSSVSSSLFESSSSRSTTSQGSTASSQGSSESSSQGSSESSSSGQFLPVGMLWWNTGVQKSAGYIYGDISGIHFPPNLLELILETTSVEGSITNWELPSTLYSLRLGSTSVTGDAVSLANRIPAIYFDFNNTQVFGDLADFPAGKFSQINLQNTQVSGDVTGWGSPSNPWSFSVNVIGLAGCPNIVGDISNWLDATFTPPGTFPQVLNIIALSNTNLTGSLDSWTWPSGYLPNNLGLFHLDVSSAIPNDNITGDLAGFKLPSDVPLNSLVLRCYGSAVTYTSLGGLLSANVPSGDVPNQQLILLFISCSHLNTSTLVDNIILDLHASGATGGTLDLTGSTAAPSATGKYYADYLNANRGWTILYN
jgi:hypothetical protein